MIAMVDTSGGSMDQLLRMGERRRAGELGRTYNRRKSEGRCSNIPVSKSNKLNTKTGMVSTAGSISHPPGFMVSFTFGAKMLFQDEWRHVSLQDNPVDDATRRVTARELLAGERRKSGPGFLYLSERTWPPLLGHRNNHEDPEVKKEVTSLAVETRETDAVDKLLLWYSSWYALQRTVDWLLRFMDWIMKGHTNLSGSRLDVTEFRAGRTAVICYVQRIHFEEAIQALKMGELEKFQSPSIVWNRYLMTWACSEWENVACIKMAANHPVALCFFLRTTR
ncbi:hypothetical protein O3P69_004640 [Scylla paramamosain]|uniref:Uncharacterized protein n=1 Tax=Scylla paramamosain TaxID=85552 RepID=A0AAW0UEI2_SCYPA